MGGREWSKISGQSGDGLARGGLDSCREKVVMGWYSSWHHQNQPNADCGSFGSENSSS